MYAVDVRVQQGELSRKMSEMRIWLDEHRFEPSIFSCHDESFGVLVSVEFRIAQEAQAFAKRFDGRTNGRFAADVDEGSMRAGGLSAYGVVG
jgi:hypothetical protein